MVMMAPRASSSGLEIGTSVKILSEGATACLFHLPLQTFVATIMKLKQRREFAPFPVIARNLIWEPPEKVIKVPFTLLILQ